MRLRMRPRTHPGRAAPVGRSALQHPSGWKPRQSCVATLQSGLTVVSNGRTFQPLNAKAVRPPSLVRAPGPPVHSPLLGWARQVVGPIPSCHGQPRRRGSEPLASCDQVLGRRSRLSTPPGRRPDPLAPTPGPGRTSTRRHLDRGPASDRGQSAGSDRSLTYAQGRAARNAAMNQPADPAPRMSP